MSASRRDGRLKWKQHPFAYELEQSGYQQYFAGAYIPSVCDRSKSSQLTQCLLPETLLEWKQELITNIANREKEICALRRHIGTKRAYLNDRLIKHLERIAESMEKAVISCRLTLQQLEVSAERLDEFERFLLRVRS